MWAKVIGGKNKGDNHNLMHLAEKLSMQYQSLIPMRGKNPIEKGWTRYCTEKRDFKPEVFKTANNVGIPCGPANNVIVLDVDNEQEFEKARKEKGWELPITHTVRTGSGGRHYYFDYPKKGQEYGNRSFKKMGFDVRGTGGVVVAPGSIHPETGREYTVERDIPMVPAPSWLLSLARKNDIESHGNMDVDISSLDITPQIKQLIMDGKPQGERSEAIIKVLNTLVGTELQDQQIFTIFDKYPIGEKYIEKGDSKEKWLQGQINNAREYVKRNPNPARIMKAIEDSEVGDARIFAQLHKDRFRFDHSEGQWYEWKGSFWEKDNTGKALSAIDKVVDAYDKALEQQGWSLNNSKDQYDDKRAKDNIAKLRERKRKLQKLQRRRNVLILAASGGADSIGISGNEWDKEPWLLGCSNGVIDLKTGEFNVSKPEDYIKNIAPTEWKGLDTPAPAWEQFLKDIFQGNSELIGFIQRLLGYSIAGVTAEHILPIFWGQGRNGKGTLIETLKYVLGPLANPIPAETLLSQKYGQSGSSHTADLMLLRGRRFVWSSETDEGRNFGVAKVKRLVGGDTIVARPPHGKDFISFDPTHTLFLLTNSKPHAAGEDFAFWKRVLLIPFELSFVSDPSKPNERKADTGLIQKLRGDASGILAWMVRGCLEWQKQGLNPPEIVKSATAEYQTEEDVIGRFISECCFESDDARVKSSDLYDAYRDWCKKNGHMSLSSTKFGKRIGERYKKIKSNGYHYLGLELPPKDPFSDSDNDF